MKHEDLTIRTISHIVLAIFSLLCIIPFVLLIAASFSDETTVLAKGYAFIPHKFSLAAYQYIASDWREIGHAYLVSICITIVGTAVSILLTAMVSYPLSRKDMPHREKFNFFIVFTMLFNGGLVPTYFMYTQLFHIKNTYLALLIPTLLMNGFNIMVMRGYFSANIPKALIEAATIDGAGEIRAFFVIVMPMSLPIIATIGLMTGLNYWNDWYNGLIYLTNQDLYSLQNVLNRMMTDIQALQNNNTGTSSVGQSTLPTETVRMAMASIAVIPIMCAYPFFQKYFVKGIALGAVKE